MDAKTLTTAWTSTCHPSPLVAEQYSLGSFLIHRQAGDAHYVLVDCERNATCLTGSLEELKAEGASRMAAGIAKAFKSQQMPDFEGADAADVLVVSDSSVALFRIHSPAAKAWVDENVEEDAQWLGSSLVVESRFVPYLIEGMCEAGLRFG